MKPEEVVAETPTLAVAAATVAATTATQAVAAAVVATTTLAVAAAVAVTPTLAVAAATPTLAVAAAAPVCWGLDPARKNSSGKNIKPEERKKTVAVGIQHTIAHQ